MACVFVRVCLQEKPLGGRRVAGLILKNQFYTRHEMLVQQKQFKWTHLQPPEAKPQIRQTLLRALASQVNPKP